MADFAPKLPKFELSQSVSLGSPSIPVVEKWLILFPNCLN
jgi:hypothetical protein